MPDQVKYDRLSSKRVLVLGGTSGIRYGVAEASVEAVVVVSSSNSSKVMAAVTRLQQSYPSRAQHISGLTCDLGEDSTIESNLVALLDQVTDSGTKKLDHVVFSAADPLAIGPLKEFDLQRMHAVARIRFFGPLLLGKHLPDYVNPGPASSFTVTSGGVMERPSRVGGVIRGLARDIAPLRVNAVSPGLVDTELWNAMSAADREGMYKHVAGLVPTGAVADPTTIAEAFLYCMRDHNATGSIVTSDGGYHLV
ncbi:hypothetical protein MRB53_036941 [Persea americana]|nr:hypothetical protein MRB53_036941 [Persea americana]